MMVKKKRAKIQAFDIVNYTIMLLFMVAIIFPFWDMIMRSLSDTKHSTALKMIIFPKGFSLSAYHYVFSDNSIIVSYGVTILRTIVGTLVSLIIVFVAAFPLSKRNLPGRNIITLYYIVPMFFSGGLIPTYIINRSLGLVDNFWVYILPSAVGVYNIVLARNYLMSIDSSLEESAFIDGAGYLRVLFSIILPVCKPIAATLALWIAVGHWNSWFDCMIYIRSSKLEVVQMLLRRMQDLTQYQTEAMQDFMMANPDMAKVTSNSVRMATTIVTLVPIMCVYPFIQKYFVKGIMVGSLKG